MSEGAAPGLIGPNAILQLVPVLARACGPDLCNEIMHRSGILALPDGSAMIPEAPAARLHQAVRCQMPDRAGALLREAGSGTADYILAHRIPRSAQWILKGLPAPLASRLLARAIARHAWTFAGSGRFRAVTATRFEIIDNPVVRGELADHPVCDWHMAVFARLYQHLVHPDFECREVQCASDGRGLCRFEMTRAPVRRPAVS